MSFNSAPLRTKADLLFSERKYSAALDHYLKSSNNAEPNLIYTFINGAQAALILNEKDTLKKFIKYAILFSDEDISYFNKNIGKIIYGCLLNKIDINIDKIKFALNAESAPIDNNYRFIFILGFPRCGTTSISETLMSTGDYIESLSPEPLTAALHIDDYDTVFDIWHSSIWKYSKSQGDTIIEKSTHHLLCDYYFQKILNRYPNQEYLVLVRDPLERALSAYRFSVMQGTLLKFDEAVCAEKKIIESLGGISNIFNSRSLFLDFLGRLGYIGIHLPIVYPSVIMSKIKDIFRQDQINNLTFFDIKTRSISGKPLSSHTQRNIMNLTTSSNKSDEIDGLTSSLPNDFFVEYPLN